MSFVSVSDRYDWCGNQLNDVNLKLIHDLKAKYSVKPPVEKGFSTTVKRLLGQWENIVVRENLLYLFRDLLSVHCSVHLKP